MKKFEIKFTDSNGKVFQKTFKLDRISLQSLKTDQYIYIYIYICTVFPLYHAVSPDKLRSVG